jgi:hypothetical protein
MSKIQHRVKPKCLLHGIPVGSSRPIICCSSSSSSPLHRSRDTRTIFHTTSVDCRANKSSSVIGGSIQIWIPNHLPKRFLLSQAEGENQVELHFLRNLYMHLTRLRIFSLFHIRHPSVAMQSSCRFSCHPVDYCTLV